MTGALPRARGRCMQNQTVHKAASLSAEVLATLETLLGRTIAADEDVSVMAIPPHGAPSQEAREHAVQRLEEMFRVADERAAERADESPDDIEEIIDEALRSVRPRYQPMR